jgi:hypothetical protein
MIYFAHPGHDHHAAEATQATIQHGGNGDLLLLGIICLFIAAVVAVYFLKPKPKTTKKDS